MNSAQFIPIIFPNHSDLASGPDTVPLGHAGLILVDQYGDAWYYEFGLYQAGENDRLTFNNSGGLGNIRGVPLPTIEFDSDGQVDASSLENALNTLTAGPKPLYPPDPLSLNGSTGMLFASPFPITNSQYSAIDNAILNGISADSFGVYDAVNPITPNDCLSFVYNMAAIGGLNIGINPRIPDITPPFMLAENPVGFEYYGPDSWNGNQIYPVDGIEFGSSPYWNSIQETDSDLNLETTIIGDFLALSNAATNLLLNSAYSVLVNYLELRSWVLSSAQTLADGTVQTIQQLASSSEQILVTAAEGSQTILNLSLETASNLMQSSVQYFTSGAELFSAYDGGGDLSAIAVNNASSLISNEGSLSDIIPGFVAGVVLDLLDIGTAISATLGAGNLLTVLEPGGGTLTLQLDPSQNFAGEGFAVSSDGNGGTDITIGTLSIAPAVTATHIEASGTAFTTQSSPAFSEGSLPITWTGTIESTYSIPGGDWTAVSGNMGAVLTSLSGTTNFADKPLAALAPASYSTLAITPPSYASVSSVSGLSATDTIGYHFSSAVPSGASFLLWAPGGNFALLQNGTVTSSDTGPETFTVSGSLDGAAVSTSGWTITVDTPSGNPPAWSYSVSPGSGQITVNTTINAPGYVFPDAVIVITPDTPIDAIEVSADTISTDEWGFAIPTALASTPVSATPPCFAEGGHIRTARGDVPVECLAAGDLVRTASGELAPIQWIGHRHVDCRRHPSPHEVWPVRIAAHAFGEGLPHRDLLLSPDHAVYVDGVLIPAKYLVNGVSVAQEPRDHVTYFHVELDRHDILLAEGLPCESYLDTGNRSAFANGAAQTMLHPQFAPLSWDNACAPLCTAGPQVIAARRRLLACLPELGYGLTDEVDLRIEVGGKPFRAARVVGDLHRFLLPAGTTAVRVASSVTIPAALDLANEDCRTLGVRIAGITANGRMIALESAAVGEGFWAIENGGDAAWRWTNGAGALTLGWSEGPVLLELLVRDIPQRWVRRDAEAAQSGQRRAA